MVESRPEPRFCCLHTSLLHFSATLVTQKVFALFFERYIYIYMRYIYITNKSYSGGNNPKHTETKIQGWKWVLISSNNNLKFSDVVWMCLIIMTWEIYLN